MKLGWLDWLDDVSSAIGAGVATAVIGVIAIVLILLACAAWAAFFSSAHAETGVASVNPSLLTAAHKRLPCGTMAKVTTRQGRSVIVRITDRGPWVRGRIVDLTPAAARVLGLSGLGYVTVEAMR